LSRSLVILGSARADGDTRRAIDLAFAPGSIDLVILPQHHVGGYDYAHANADDDFAAIAEAMRAAPIIVFATPVYWYAMSASLKIFFDRLTDLTENLKPHGKALAGKPVWLIATGTEAELPEGFEVPFRRAAEYFGMHYRGGFYLHTGNDAGLRRRGETECAAWSANVLASSS
jgi:multimeric flavodoxin WrbA